MILMIFAIQLLIILFCFKNSLNFKFENKFDEIINKIKNISIIINDKSDLFTNKIKKKTLRVARKKNKHHGKDKEMKTKLIKKKKSKKKIKKKKKPFKITTVKQIETPIKVSSIQKLFKNLILLSKNVIIIGKIIFSGDIFFDENKKNCDKEINLDYLLKTSANHFYNYAESMKKIKVSERGYLSKLKEKRIIDKKIKRKVLKLNLLISKIRGVKPLKIILEDKNE